MPASESNLIGTLIGLEVATSAVSNEPINHMLFSRAKRAQASQFIAGIHSPKAERVEFAL